MFGCLAFVMQELKLLEERLVVSSRHPAFVQLLVNMNRVSRPEHLAFTWLFAVATMRSARTLHFRGLCLIATIKAQALSIRSDLYVTYTCVHTCVQAQCVMPLYGYQTWSHMVCMYVFVRWCAHEHCVCAQSCL